MQATRPNLPELDDATLDLWISVLVDNELDSAQRRQLIEFLDAHPHGWRHCAVALWDDRLLGQAWRSTDRSPDRSKTVARVEPARRRPMPARRGVRAWLTAAAMVVVVASLSGWLVAERHRTTQRELQTEVLLLQDYSQALLARWSAEREVLRSLTDLFPESPNFVEIEDSTVRTVYLTDRPVSDELIRCLVATGRRIEVRPYEPQIVTAMWQSLKRPVVAIEVYKVPHLIAQGASQ